jgi:hypothetical protein
VRVLCSACGNAVANPAREGGLAVRKALYDPRTGLAKAICDKCKAVTPLPRFAGGKTLVIG